MSRIPVPIIPASLCPAFQPQAGEAAQQGREAEIQAGECQAERAEDPLAAAD